MERYYEKETVHNYNGYRIGWNHMYFAFGKSEPADGGLKKRHEYEKRRYY